MACRIGVFVCDCKGLVSDSLDTTLVAEDATTLAGVGFVQRVGLFCSQEGLDLAATRLKEEGCERMLFVGCSPRSSLKFPEERISTAMESMGLERDLVEVANVREQCAWQHSDREAATGKAIDLVRMAHARLVEDVPGLAATQIPKKALIIGGGPAGLQAAKDLASANIEVTVTERNSWIGGRLCQLDRVFQSEGWPSVCDSFCVGPVQGKGAILSEKIQVLTQTQVGSVERTGGSFRVALDSAPAFVNPDLCISCNKCTEVCPEELICPFDQKKSKAIDKAFERALPATYAINSDACTKCGNCLPVCPTGAIDLEAQARTATDNYGAVFLATGVDPIDLTDSPRYLKRHPNVVTSIEFENMLTEGVLRPSDGEEPERVTFVQCAGSRAAKGEDGVSYCSKTCCSVTAKQVNRLMLACPMTEPTVIYRRGLRTYERAMEELNVKLDNMGVEFVNGEVRETTGGEEDELLLTIEPIVDEDDEASDINLETDLVVLATAQVPAQGSRELYRLFGVELDQYGFPIENQVRLFRPTESLVNRVYAIGSSVGPKVVQQASEQGSTAAMRALPSLLTGEAEPLRFASRVNPDRCIRCGFCETICPHGAIQLTESGAVVDPAFCQACGFCAAACPSHAAELANFTDRQLLSQIEVAFSNVPEGEPKILALLCYWCSYSGADSAGIQRLEAPSNYRVVRIRCASSVNSALMLKAFTMGVDGILVAGCPQQSCHHLYGNFVADKRIELVRKLMGQLGMDQSRLRFEYIGSAHGEKLVDTIQKIDKKMRTLAPNPVAKVTG